MAAEVRSRGHRVRLFAARRSEAGSRPTGLGDRPEPATTSPSIEGSSHLRCPGRPLDAGTSEVVAAADRAGPRVVAPARSSCSRRRGRLLAAARRVGRTRWTRARSRCSRSPCLAGIAARARPPPVAGQLMNDPPTAPLLLVAVWAFFARRALRGSPPTGSPAGCALRRCPPARRPGQLPARAAPARARGGAARARRSSALAGAARASTAATSSAAAAPTTARATLVRRARRSRFALWAVACSCSACAACTAGAGAARSATVALALALPAAHRARCWASSP